MARQWSCHLQRLTCDANGAFLLCTSCLDPGSYSLCGICSVRLVWHLFCLGKSKSVSLPQGWTSLSWGSDCIILWDHKACRKYKTTVLSEAPGTAVCGCFMHVHKQRVECVCLCVCVCVYELYCMTALLELNAHMLVCSCAHPICKSQFIH